LQTQVPSIVPYIVRSVKGNGSNHLVKSVTFGDTSLLKMDYLDLAGVNTARSEWKPKPFECLNLAVLPRFEQPAFFVVRHGHRVLINRAILKSHGPAESMVLFSLFPVEIRRKIYDHALLRDEEVSSKVVDNGTGQWVSRGIIEPNYFLMASSIDAHKYLSAKYDYTSIYKGGITVFSPKVDHYVKLTIVATTADPNLQIAPMFSNHFSMANIGSLVFEISGLNNDNAARWIRSNLAGMTNLKFLFIHCFCTISVPEQSKVSFHVEAKVPSNRKCDYTYSLYTKNDEGYDICQDGHAQIKIGTLVAKQEEQQGIMDIWMALDRCYKNQRDFPKFPKTVIMAFYWDY
jgi:hypothetical protein